MNISSEDLSLMKSLRVQDNLSKEMNLVVAIKASLELLGIGYTPLYLNHSYKKAQHMADFDLGGRGRIEAKNWNCENYTVGFGKVASQILPRFPDDGKPKLLIISNPRWEPDVKAYLQACGVLILELGFYVSSRFEDYLRTIFDLCDAFRRIGLDRWDFVIRQDPSHVHEASIPVKAHNGLVHTQLFYKQLILHYKLLHKKLLLLPHKGKLLLHKLSHSVLLHKLLHRDDFSSLNIMINKGYPGPPFVSLARPLAVWTVKGEWICVG